MKNKHVLVTLKYYNGELNPFDCSALECALLSGAYVSVLAMAPISVKGDLENLTRLNLDAYLISDPVYAGSDTLVTSAVLCEAIKRIKPDLIFCGRQSIDGDTAQVPPMLAQRLGFNFENKIIDITDGKFTTRSGKSGKFCVNTIYTFERIKSLRFPSIFSKKKEVKLLSNDELLLDINAVGLKGSPTQVIKAYESKVGRRFCEFVSADKLPSLITEKLALKKAENKVCASGEKLKEVYYFGNIEEIALAIADRAIKVEYEGKTAFDIVKLLTETNAANVLFSDIDELKILSAQIAVLTGSGLCADCIFLRVEQNKLIMTRPAQGGNITADIVCKSKMTLATVRTKEKEGADLIISFGRGAVDHIDRLSEQAKKYGAETCASRAVVDMNKMPYKSQVGLTGRIVAPKVYLALGISGAVQHTVAISGAETVIAINSDKTARIFDYADFGIVVDIKDINL